MATIGEGKATDLQLPGSYVLGMIDDHLVYDTQAGVLMAVPFDIGKRKVLGPPVSVLEGIAVGANGAAQAAISRSGTLVYQTGALLRHALITDLRGASISVLLEPGKYSVPRFSPDGSRIAIGLLTQGTADIWMYDLRSQTLGRITTEGDVNDRAERSPDGRRIIFRSNRGGPLALWSQPADGTGKAELVLRDPVAEIWRAFLRRRKEHDLPHRHRRHCRHLGPAAGRGHDPASARHHALHRVVRPAVTRWQMARLRVQRDR